MVTGERMSVRCNLLIEIEWMDGKVETFDPYVGPGSIDAHDQHLHMDLEGNGNNTHYPAASIRSWKAVDATPCGEGITTFARVPGVLPESGPVEGTGLACVLRKGHRGQHQTESKFGMSWTWP